MAAKKADIHLIVGLGNPGADYHQTRHNAGFWFVDALADYAGLSFRHDKKFLGDVSKFRHRDKDVHLIKPMTFMNKSGQSVAALARYFKLKPEQLLVVHDELDLSPSDNRLKFSGGHGGHNGLRDIISHLGSKDFYRLRIGIGHPGSREQVVNYVLHQPAKAEREQIDSANQRALDVMPELLDDAFEKAMQQLHS